jgi:hypothetical protein
MSTIKVTNINPPTAGEAVNLNGLAYPTAGPLSNRNLVINGAMQVAQRGTSSTASGYGTVDRFRSQPTSGTVTQSQELLTSGDPYDEGFRYFLRTTNTTAGSDDAAEQREIRQYIEAQNLASSGWNYTSSTSYCTLSFWARSSVGGTYYVLNRSIDGTSQGYTFSFALTADTWTKVTHAIPGNSNITVDNDNGIGFQVRVLTDLGTNYTDSGHTLDTWAAFNDSSRCPDFDHDWAGTTDATFDLTGVQLEVGSVATPFEHRSYGDELRRCQRYYHKIKGGVENDPFANGINWDSPGTAAVFQYFFPVEMRTKPTALEQSGTASDYKIAYRTTAATCSSGPTYGGRSTQYTTEIGASISSGMTQGDCVSLRAKTANAYLAWSAEL